MPQKPIYVIYVRKYGSDQMYDFCYHSPLHPPTFFQRCVSINLHDPAGRAFASKTHLGIIPLFYGCQAPSIGILRQELTLDDHGSGNIFWTGPEQYYPPE